MAAKLLMSPPSPGTSPSASPKAGKQAGGRPERRLPQKERQVTQPTFSERLKQALTSLPLEDQAFKAFYAAYLVNCEQPHLGESIAGKGSSKSVLSALQWALRHRRDPQALPPNVNARFGPAPTIAFRDALIAAVEQVDATTLELAAKESSAAKDEGAYQNLLRGNFWYYVLSAENADPF